LFLLEESKEYVVQDLATFISSHSTKKKKNRFSLNNPSLYVGRPSFQCSWASEVREFRRHLFLHVSFSLIGTYVHISYKLPYAIAT
jgi:hypothetical protein